MQSPFKFFHDETICTSLQVPTNLLVSPIMMIQNFIKYCQRELWLFLVLKHFYHSWHLPSGIRTYLISFCTLSHFLYDVILIRQLSNICQNGLSLFSEENQEDFYLDKILRTPVIFYETMLLGIRGASLNICYHIYPCLVILSLFIHRFRGSLTLCSYKDFLSHSFAYVYDYRLKNHTNLL